MDFAEQTRLIFKGRNPQRIRSTLSVGRTLLRESMKDLRLEDQLVVHCARTSVDQNRFEAINELLEHDLGWKRVLATSRRNSVTSLVYHNISAVSQTCLESQPKRVLKRRFHRITRRNLRLKAELLKILRLFEADGVACLPVKGPVLAETVYKDLSLREFGDLDILIGDADYHRAVSLLQTLGYERDDKTDAHLAKHLHHERFRYPENRTLVELHWELAERYRAIFQIRDLPRIAFTQIEFEGIKVTALTREFLLLYLCVHGYRHQWERLSWICDIAEIVNTAPPLDWDLLYRQAKELHILKILQMGLCLADEILECEIPTSIRQKMPEDGLIRDLGERVRLRLFTDGVAPVDEREKEMREEYFLFNYALLTHPLHKARYFGLLMYSLFISRLRLSPNERDRSIVRLPKGFALSYAFMRPLRLVKQYGFRRIRLLYRVLSKQLQ